jgi:hypothetical protein
MTTIVDEFTNGMSADTARANMRAVVEAYGYDGSGSASDVRAFANTLLVPAGRSIGAAELGGGLRDDWNLLRDPSALNFAIAKAADPTALVLDAEYMRTGDFASAAPDWGVGAQNIYSADGTLVASQATEAHRVRAARRPLVLRNRANGAHNTGNSTFWKDSETQNGITVAKLSSSAGRVRYGVTGVATAEATIQVYSRANSDAVTQPSAQWLASLTAQVFGSPPPSGSGLRVLVREADASDAPIGLVSSTPFNSTSATPLTRDITISTGARVSAFIDVRIASGLSVDFEFDLTDFQFENSASRTAYQANMSQFDITEAGVRSVTEFDADGITDWMQLASNFAPAGAYSIAAAIRTSGGAAIYANFGACGGIGPIWYFRIERTFNTVWCRKSAAMGGVACWRSQLLFARVRGVSDYDMQSQRGWTLPRSAVAWLWEAFFLL